MARASWQRRMGRQSPGARRKPGVRPRLEALELRLTPAVHTWNPWGPDSLGNYHFKMSDDKAWTGGSPASDPSATLVYHAVSDPVLRGDSYNDVPGVTVHSIQADTDWGGIFDWDKGGDPINLTGDISSTGSGFWVYVDCTLTGGTNHRVTVDQSLRIAMLKGSAGDTLTKEGPGALTLNYPSGKDSFDDPNTFAGTIVVNEGTVLLAKLNTAVLGPLVIGTNADGAPAALVQDDQGEQFAATVPVTINRSGMLDLHTSTETLGALTMTGGQVKGGIGYKADLILNGPVTGNAAPESATINSTLSLGTGSREFTIADGDAPMDMVLANVIFGAGGLAKRGPGTQLLKGGAYWDGSAVLQNVNLYTGPTDVYEGVLLVNATQRDSPVTVHDHGTLGGTGNVGAVTAQDGGTVSPGVNGPGILTATTVDFQAGSIFRVELNGTGPGASHDQLGVHDTVSLGGGVLNASLSFEPDVGTRFTIIDNQGAGPVNGTFAGLPEGATAVIAGQQFAVSYHGGDGNDVVLTALPGGGPNTLTLTFSPPQVSEAAGDHAATGTVTRTGPAAGALVVQLARTDSGSHPEDLQVPATVTIPAGAASVSFSAGVINNTFPDGTRSETITATALGYVPASASLTVLDDETSPTIQFGAAHVTVKENAGRAALTLTRSGRSSDSMSVDYVVAVPSSLPVKNRATPGTDFQGDLSGTVTFQPGQTQQTISFPILTDNLVEATESFTVTLQNPTSGVILGSPAAATVAIMDANLPVVSDDTPRLSTLQLAGSGFGKSEEHYRNFVTEAYRRYLDRLPDEQGFTYWVTLMRLYEQSNHTRGLRQQDIEAGFLDSPEYLGRFGGVGEAWVRGIYHDLLDREADADGLASWLAALNAGMAPTDVASGFTASLERLRNRVTDTYFTLLGRAPDRYGLDYWTAVFQFGGTTEDINSGFVGSVEYFNKPDGAAGNPARWVCNAYLDVLGRPARTDEMGYWLDFLEA